MLGGIIAALAALGLVAALWDAWQSLRALWAARPEIKAELEREARREARYSIREIGKGAEHESQR